MIKLKSKKEYQLYETTLEGNNVRNEFFYRILPSNFETTDLFSDINEILKNWEMKHSEDQELYQWPTREIEKFFIDHKTEKYKKHPLLKRLDIVRTINRNNKKLIIYNNPIPEIPISNNNITLEPYEELEEILKSGNMKRIKKFIKKHEDDLHDSLYNYYQLNYFLESSNRNIQDFQYLIDQSIIVNMEEDLNTLIEEKNLDLIEILLESNTDCIDTSIIESIILISEDRPELIEKLVKEQLEDYYGKDFLFMMNKPNLAKLGLTNKYFTVKGMLKNIDNYNIYWFLKDNYPTKIKEKILGHHIIKYCYDKKYKKLNSLLNKLDIKKYGEFIDSGFFIAYNTNDIELYDVLSKYKKFDLTALLDCKMKNIFEYILKDNLDQIDQFVKELSIDDMTKDKKTIYFSILKEYPLIDKISVFEYILKNKHWRFNFVKSYYPLTQQEINRLLINAIRRYGYQDILLLLKLKPNNIKRGRNIAIDLKYQYIVDLLK